MTDTTPVNPHKEEDEGYLAAEAGRSITENIYPNGTIRFEHWRRGWRIKNGEIRRAATLGTVSLQEDEGYQAAAAGLALTANPYPFGTIRHDHWRCGWQVRTDATRRTERLRREVKP